MNLLQMEKVKGLPLSELLANAASTFAAFRREGVDVKVISGDHPAVVSAAARQAGLKGFDSYIDMAIEGYPAFFMSFEPDNRKITGAFLPQVLRRSIPNALATVCMVGMILLLSSPLGISPAQTSLLAYMIVGVLGMEGVFKACIPFNKLHGFLFCSMLAGFFTALFLFHSLLRLPLPDPGLIPLFIALSAMSVAAERIFDLLCSFTYSAFITS